MTLSSSPRAASRRSPRRSGRARSGPGAPGRHRRPPPRRSRASAASARPAPPCASPNRRRYGVAPASASSGALPRARLQHEARRAIEALDRLAQPRRRSGRRPAFASLTSRARWRALPAISAAHRVAARERQLARDEVDRLDAVGALVDRRDAGVAQMLRRAGLLDEAHAAMDLHAERGDLDADVGRQGLGDRGQQRRRAQRAAARASSLGRACARSSASAVR